MPATAGASSPRTSLIPNQMRLPSRTGKKLSTKIAYVLQDWLTQAPVKLMFQDEAREKYFHNRVFDSLDALEDQLEAGLLSLEANPDRVETIVAWQWLIDSAMQ
jgi:hypothetical protein